MDAIDMLAPRFDGEDEELAARIPDFADTTDLSIDVYVDDGDGWLTRLREESDRLLRTGQDHQALDLLGLALRIDPQNDITRARYVAVAAKLSRARRRGDDTLQIAV